VATKIPKPLPNVRRIIHIIPLFTLRYQGLTHAFFEKLEGHDVSSLTEANVVCLATDYIGDYLTNWPTPQQELYNFFSNSFLKKQERLKLLR